MKNWKNLRKIGKVSEKLEKSEKNWKSQRKIRKVREKLERSERNCKSETKFILILSENTLSSARERNFRKN